MLNTSFKQFVFALLLFASCAEEQVIREPEDIDIQTKGYIDVSIADENVLGEVTDDIKTIRFIIFDGQGPNAKMEVNDYRSFASEADRVTKLKGVFEVSKADKLLVAIANEPPSMRGSLGLVTNRQELEALQMNMTDVFLDENNADGNYQEFKPDVMMMPMSGALWISKGDLKTKEEAINNLTPLKLERAVARVDVYLTTDITGGVELLPGSSVTLKNTYTQSPFIHHENEDINRLGHIQTVPASKFITSKWNTAEPSTIRELSDTIHICTFYTPERNCAADKLAVNFSLKTNDGDKSAAFTLDYMYNKAGDRLPIEVVKRNNRYIVKGKIRKSPFLSTDGGIEILRWNEGLESFPLGQYYLRVDKSLLEFPSGGGTQTVDVATNHPDEWVIDDITNLPAGITATQSGNTIIVTALPQTPGSAATAGSFIVRAGNLRKIVHVTQEDAPTYSLTVTKNKYLFTSISEIEQELTISTDHPDGWEITPKLQDWPKWLNNGVSTWSVMRGDKDITTTGNFWPDVYTEETDREFTFTVTAGPLSEQITVKQRKNGYVFAAPGIPGIPMGQYRQMMIDRAHSGNWAKIGPGVELTLRGSSTYAGTRVAPTATEFGGLHDDVVFTVYFLWGSTVAMVRDVSERWRGDGREVVWVNPGFTGSTVGAMNSPSAFGQATARSFGQDYDIADNAAKGHGDICGVLSNSTYRTPRGNPWQLADGSRPWSYNYTGKFKEAYWQDPNMPAYYFDKIQDPADYVYTGYARSRIFALKGDGMFLPAAHTQTDGNFAGAGLWASYLTSTTYTAKDYYIIDLAPDRYEPDLIDANRERSIAYPVRCVTKTPKYNLEVSPRNLEFPNTESIKTVTVTTNHPDGWEIDGITNLPAGITVEKSGNTVNVKAGAKKSNDPASEGSFVIKAGGMSETITVKQAEGPSAYKKMRTYGWGYFENDAGYLMQPGSGIRKIVDAPANFGTNANSTVKIERYSTTQTFDHTVLSSGKGVYLSQYIKEMFDSKPDIVFTGYDLAVGEPAKAAGYVMEYLRNGGVLVLTLEHLEFARQIFSAMYSGRTIMTGGVDEWDFQIANAVNDEITNGQFGDIRGRYWGNDCNTECAVRGLPEDDIIVYSRTRAGDPIMFRHKTYNLFFIGEGGAFANLRGGTGSIGGTAGSTETHPLAFDNNFKPITRTGWRTANANGNGNVENGRLFANIMAWAVKTAATKGINK
jgi:hypothetical protein